MRQSGLGLVMAVLMLTAGGLVAAPSAGAQPTPGEDSVSGSALFVDDQCPNRFDCGTETGIDARSGPSGENPSGSVVITVLVMPTPGVIEPGPSFTLAVTCLNVQGSRASVGATGVIGSFLLTVEDGGGAGQDRFASSSVPAAPAQCPAPPPPGSGLPDPSGDLAV